MIIFNHVYNISENDTKNIKLSFQPQIQNLPKQKNNLYQNGFHKDLRLLV